MTYLNVDLLPSGGVSLSVDGGLSIFGRLVGHDEVVVGVVFCEARRGKGERGGM